MQSDRCLYLIVGVKTQPHIIPAKMEICFVGLYYSPDHNSREVFWTVITEEGRAQLAYALELIEI